jgi:hypothetical protein
MSNSPSSERIMKDEYEDNMYLSECISIVQAFQMSKNKEDSLKLHNDFINLQLKREKKEKVNQVKRWYF